MKSRPFGVSIESETSKTVSAKAPNSFLENDIRICLRESPPSGSSFSGNGLNARMWIPVEVGQYSLAWGQGQPSGQFLLHGQRSEQWANSRLQSEVQVESPLHSFEHSTTKPWQSSTHWSFSRKKFSPTVGPHEQSRSSYIKDVPVSLLHVLGKIVLDTRPIQQANFIVKKRACFENRTKVKKIHFLIMLILDVGYISLCIWFFLIDSEPIYHGPH